MTCRFVGVCHIDNGGCHQLASCSETPGESSDTFSVQGCVVCVPAVKACIDISD